MYGQYFFFICFCSSLWCVAVTSCSSFDSHFISLPFHFHRLFFNFTIVGWCLSIQVPPVFSSLRFLLILLLCFPLTWGLYVVSLLMTTPFLFFFMYFFFLLSCLMNCNLCHRWLVSLLCSFIGLYSRWPIIHLSYFRNRFSFILNNFQFTWNCLSSLLALSRSGALLCSHVRWAWNNLNSLFI